MGGGARAAFAATAAANDASQPQHASRISTMQTLSHIALASSNPRRTADLFVQVFGASILPHAADAKGPPELTVQLGELKLVFVQGVGPQALGVCHVAFNVPAKDAEHVRGRLLALGLQVQSPRAGAARRALYFADYDNNLFEVCFV
jgi:catechol 2,3-dioxygenase-like lactoylglutathione lyase family enzyme